MSATGAAAPPLRVRIMSVDLLRGLVMILMALDHVRDFWGPTPFDPLDLSQTSPALYFTRWITHFCAPVFIFLAGTSAFLYQRNTGASKRELSFFLATRGLWLIFIEATVVTFSWQLAYNFVILQVIWAIGWSMLVLAVLVHLSVRAIAVISITIIALHNLLDGINAASFGDWHWLWAMLHQGFYFVPLDGFGVFLAYPLIPWVAVMAAGYVFGEILMRDPPARDRIMKRLGLALIFGFILLRALNVYGDLDPWTVQERGWFYTVLSFLDVEKYPPSLLYLMAMLGPALLLMPYLENWRGRAAEAVKVFGRVPFFFYVIHIPLINITASIYAELRYGSHGWWLQGPNAYPPDYEPSLLLTYAAWVATVAVLYPACRWYEQLKRRRSDWWLRYL